MRQEACMLQEQMKMVKYDIQKVHNNNNINNNDNHKGNDHKKNDNNKIKKI